MVILARPGFDPPVDTKSIAAMEQAVALLAAAGAYAEEASSDLPDTRLIFPVAGPWPWPGW